MTRWADAWGSEALLSRRGCGASFGTGAATRAFPTCGRLPAGRRCGFALLGRVDAGAVRRGAAQFPEPVAPPPPKLPPPPPVKPPSPQPHDYDSIAPARGISATKPAGRFAAVLRCVAPARKVAPPADKCEPAIVRIVPRIELHLEAIAPAGRCPAADAGSHPARKAGLHLIAAVLIHSQPP